MLILGTTIALQRISFTWYIKLRVVSLLNFIGPYQSPFNPNSPFLNPPSFSYPSEALDYRVFFNVFEIFNTTIHIAARQPHPPYLAYSLYIPFFELLVSALGMLPNMSPTLPVSVSQQLPSLKILQELTVNYGAVRPEFVPDLDLLWLTLKDCGAQLKKIHLEYGISAALMQYLASYTGLKEGTFNFALPSTIPPSSNYFARIALPRHVQSLVNLEIISTAQNYNASRNSMVIEPEIWPVPSSFLYLKTLHVLTPANWVLDVGYFQQLVYYIMELPKLEILLAEWSTLGTDEGFSICIKRIGDECAIK
ncbi:hypothetical protein AX16_005769 [Volvariella volvacea WC 439]|nr:hypothetical protein AX16_005769 [Volvariella volvacea WC 439]